MNKKDLPEIKSPLEILLEWLKENNKSISQFAKETDYTYHHSFLLLSENRPINESVIGRLLVVYQDAGPAFEMAKALHLQRNGHANSNGHKA